MNKKEKTSYLVEKLNEYILKGRRNYNVGKIKNNIFAAGIC